jgi:hypothetical protein
MFVPKERFAESLTPSRKLEIVEDKIEEILGMIETIGLEIYIDERSSKGMKAKIAL